MATVPCAIDGARPRTVLKLVTCGLHDAQLHGPPWQHYVLMGAAVTNPPDTPVQSGTPRRSLRFPTRLPLGGSAPNTSAGRQPTGDRRLAVVGGLCVALSVGGVLGHMVGALPSSAATLVVFVAGGIGLRAAITFLARSASSPARARVMTRISTVGLVVSGVTLIASLPVTTRAGGIGVFLADLLAQLWTLAALTAAASPVRTLGWRVYVGAGLTGFLALTSLAGFVGRPVMAALGTDSVLATSVWVPLSEDFCKALPVLIVLLLAVRRRTPRPSAIDLALIGAWTGAGFALYEDTQFGRGGGDWSAALPFSLLFPSEAASHGDNASMVISGHAVWAALVGLSLGFGILYRRRYSRAWLAVPVTVGATLLEHGAANALGAVTSNGDSPTLETLMLVLTLGGWLSSILLVGGFAGVLWIEVRAIETALRPREWWPLRPITVSWRGQRLAAAQAPTRLGSTSAPLGSTGSST